MSGITNFRPSGGAAYQPLEYTATKSATATCPTGKTGAPVTRTATKTSFLSQEEADGLAYQAALAEATAALVCTVVPAAAPVTYSATKDYTAVCGTDKPGVGASVTRTGTASSTQHQADADTKAWQSAKALAVAALVCTIPWGRTLTGPSDSYDGVELTSSGAQMFRYDPLSSGDSLPCSMDISVGGTPVANVVFLGRYVGKSFSFEHAGQTYTSTFINGTVTF
ncbi:DUF5977 domain-containing protein [Hymenobacter metallilatus]|uniref:DUF5977 domain-containing protein n=1 Tax=Hymenobacter metallilatus TaxID=2493666 RepID=A0A428IYL3_9BACT|nr:hypothetical protein [Hymenobacter metallilatus]RSK24192.1 hypothetical protein EI290_20645 [Hymenobacter metallilatus]